LKKGFLTGGFLNKIRNCYVERVVSEQHGPKSRGTFIYLYAM